MRRRAPLTSLFVCAALASGLSCGGPDDPGPDGPGAVEILDEGSGAANERPLFPIRSGSVLHYLGAAVRAPVEVASGRVAYRYTAQPDTFFTDAVVDVQNESYFSVDDAGVWFEGDARRGPVDSPILLVPAEVRVGMRWRTGRGGEERTYSVVSREEQETRLGPTVFWLTEQQTPTPIYRLYAEGWGLVAIEQGAPPAVPSLYRPLRAVLGDSPEPVQDLGPPLTPTLVEGLELPLSRMDSARAIRHGAGGAELFVDLLGVHKGVGRPDGVTQLRLLYRDGDLALATSEPPGVRHGHWGIGASYWDGPGGILGIGNVLFVGGVPHWSVEELPMFENTLGGVGGAYLHVSGEGALHNDELPLAAPTYGPEGGFTNRPIWGAFHRTAASSSPMRVLLGDGATVERVPLATVIRGTSELWAARLESVPHGRYLTEPVFVESFPDLGFSRGPRIDTTTGEGSQTHLLVTPGGVIDRIVVDLDGARRERLGHVELPDGHLLRLAAQAADGTLVIMSYAPDAPRELALSYLWTVTPAAAAPVAPAPFVSLEWTGLDARVCWPATDAPLDSSSWRLGPAAAAAVIPVAERCALVVRDLEATPAPAPAAELPAGWEVFEGEVPGVGLVRAYEPSGSASQPAPTGGAWVEGDRVVDSSCGSGTVSCSSERYGPGGMFRGRPVFGGGAHPDPRGAGVWGATQLRDFPDTHCDAACDPPLVWGLTLSGPTPRWFPAVDDSVAPPIRFAVRSGGVVASGVRVGDTDYPGLVRVTADGAATPISAPAEYVEATVMLVRESGEVCGRGVDAAGVAHVFCARADGTDRREVPWDVRATPTFGLGWVMLDDDTALVVGPPALGSGADLLWTLDLASLDHAPYPGTLDPASLGERFVGADGLVYASPPTAGALLPDGFVPLSDIYDPSRLIDPGAPAAEVSAFVVTEHVVFLGVGEYGLRVPRSRWDGATGCEPTTAPGLDADGDGFVAATSCGRDCDDGDADVHPGAVDVCDGVDNDCDGELDTGASCWADGDRDGYAADAAEVMTACGCPDGFTARPPLGDEVDCDDADARAFPGQTEFFDTRSAGTRGFDFDCDGATQKRWPATGACVVDASDECTTTDGFVFDVECGAFGGYLGCPVSGTCGAGCAWMGDIATGGRMCQPPAASAQLMWQQACR